MNVKQKQQHLKQALKILKEHCMSRDICEGCELDSICECLFDINIKVEDWEID